MDKDKLIDKVLDNITFEKIIKHTMYNLFNKNILNGEIKRPIRNIILTEHFVIHKEALLTISHNLFIKHINTYKDKFYCKEHYRLMISINYMV